MLFETDTTLGQTADGNRTRALDGGRLPPFGKDYISPKAPLPLNVTLRSCPACD